MGKREWTTADQARSDCESIILEKLRDGIEVFNGQVKGTVVHGALAEIEKLVRQSFEVGFIEGYGTHYTDNLKIAMQDSYEHYIGAIKQPAEASK